MGNGVQDLTVYFYVNKIGIRPQFQHYRPRPTRDMQLGVPDEDTHLKSSIMLRVMAKIMN